ncbi:MAG: DUF4157 domain-containing protein [Prochloraceae cyanobacterium]
MSDRAKIVKSNNFIPLAKSQIVSNSSKKEANQPQSSSLQINDDNFVSKEENTELMCLEFENRFGKLPPQDKNRLTYLQTKSDRLFYEQHRAQLSIMRDLKNRAQAKDRHSSNGQKPEISEIDPEPKLSLFTEEERVRLKPLVEQYKKNRNGPRVNRIQSKLTIGKPGDKYEQEADRVADLVTNAPDPLQRQDLLETDEELRAKSLIQRSENIPTEEDEVKVSSLDIQRMDEANLDEGEEELISPQSEMSNLSLEEEEILQTKKSDFENKSNTEDLETKLNNSKGSGDRLPETTKDFMESRFGADFSNVRVHNDSMAASMSESISARAFTTGSDIYFNNGKYSPDSNEGRKLLAHELTHVLQQRGEEIAPKIDRQIQKQEKSENKSSDKSSDKKDEANPIARFLNYVWGTVIGDWNNELDPLQIIVNTGVGLVPIADQVLDLRDFTAHLYYMVFQKDYQDPMRWLALALTAVGAIPFVGSIVKGLGKIALFSDAAKGISKFAEPFLQQIKQINPEWADIGNLRAAIDQNWSAGVATSKQVWMDLLATTKDKLGLVPLPTDFVWGAGKLTQLKQDFINTISEIQKLSPQMLDDALERIRSEVDIILRELDRIAKEKLGQPELIPEAVGDKVGAYNRTSVEPPQKVEPLQISGSPGSGGSITLTPGPSFKKHFLSKKKLLGDFLGKQYPKLKTDGPIFLKDIADLINNGTVTLVGQGTLKKGQPPVNVYRGSGLTVITKPSGEWVTILETGKGLDLGIQMIIP